MKEFPASVINYSMYWTFLEKIVIMELFGAVRAGNGQTGEACREWRGVGAGWRMRRRKDDRRIVMQSLAMVMQFGLNMIVPICLMTALGVWLDGKLGTSWITIVLFVIGAVAGAQNIYRMAKGLYGSEEQDGERGVSGESDKDDHKGIKK